MNAVIDDSEREAAANPDQILAAGQARQMVGDKLDDPQGALHLVDHVQVALRPASAGHHPVIQADHVGAERHVLILREVGESLAVAECVQGAQEVGGVGGVIVQHLQAIGAQKIQGHAIFRTDGLEELHQLLAGKHCCVAPSREGAHGVLHVQQNHGDALRRARLGHQLVGVNARRELDRRRGELAVARFLGEGGYGLFLTVVEYLEIFLLEVGDRLTFVTDDDVNLDETCRTVKRRGLTAQTACRIAWFCAESPEPPCCCGSGLAADLGGGSVPTLWTRPSEPRQRSFYASDIVSICKDEPGSGGLLSNTSIKPLKSSGVNG